MNELKNLLDEVLIKKYQKGDTKALNHLVKRWHFQLCKFAFWIVKDADIAKDITQESWVIIINKIESLQNPRKFKSWALSIVKRKAIDSLRANNKEKINLKNHKNSIVKEDIYYKKEENKILQIKLLQSIEKLSIEHKMVIKLFYKESYTLKEISEILKISVGTTKSRLFHAREKLKTSLKHIKNEK
jgi:RNA polymerase sigma-70 factor (ECF subfamily)